MQNAILIFSLIFIYTTLRYDKNQHLAKQILIGILIGVLTYLLMRTPWRLEEGLFFDARTVMMSVTGVFFGFVPTVIALVITLTYRISLGGVGVYSGVLTLLTSAIIGLYWHKIKRYIPKIGTYYEYLVLGFIVHVVTLLCFLTIPYPRSIYVIQSTIIPYLVLFPIVTMFLSVIIHNQQERLYQEVIIKQQQTLLQASIDSTPTMEIFAIDREYKYLSMNEFHKKQMNDFYGIIIEVGENYLDYITDTKMKDRIKSYIDSALSDDPVKTIIEVEVSKDKYIEEHYTPIKDSKDKIIGVTIFSEDVTERHTYEQSILNLSYRDPLTNLYNRRYYQEELKRLDENKYYPLSIVLADINGLKIMNDAFGHDAGDQLIKVVSEELLKIFHRHQRVARIGGDEFAILLPNVTRDRALSLLDTVKLKLELKTIHNMHISVSFGIATKNDQEDLNEIIKRAEDDMYAHKLFEVGSQRNETIRTIIKTMHEKNPREEQHSKRVSDICQRIGMKLGMPSNDLGLLKAISALHDIGKIAIDDYILNKPGKLDAKEWEAIKKHPEIGYRILSATAEYAAIAEDILSHHERYDGNGYPRGLAGEDIPIRARIIAVADSYDAMVSDRPYRKALTHEEAIAEIKRCSGTQFDPMIAEIFLEICEKERIA